MKVKEMKSILKSNKFDNYCCNFKINKDGHKTTLDDVMNELKSIKVEIKSINNRIDNLVIKNNLKE